MKTESERRRVYFHDNVCVKSGRNGREFFAVHVADPEKPIEGVMPYVCRISRYMVPGRCDFYSFAEMDRKIIFWSETDMSLLEASQRALTDLGRESVIEMIAAGIPKLPYLPRHSLFRLIDALSPKGRLQKLLKLPRLIKASNQ